MSNFVKATPSAEAERSEEQLVLDAEQLYRERSATRLNRRKMLTGLGIAAGAASIMGVAGCSNAGPALVATPAGAGPSALDVLNFALNLEYLEATFYSVVVTGSGLSAADMGTGAGTASGGTRVAFTNSFVATIAANLMQEEVEHVELLRATIQSAFNTTPVSMPTLNLQPTTAYAVTNDATFLAVARQLEAVGVSAYIGGAQYLVGSIPALTYAAQILDLEAQHEGALRAACLQLNVASPAADTLDMPPTSSKIFNTSSSMGLNPVRTISQVLNIVYGNSSATTNPSIIATGLSRGGFFPNGLNGAITTT
ncbi:MAG: ferritin-like domain-containing protein [Janthinobacterium lividum]